MHKFFHIFGNQEHMTAIRGLIQEELLSGNLMYVQLS